MKKFRAGGAIKKQIALRKEGGVLPAIVKSQNYNRGSSR